MVNKWYHELENKFPDIKCHEHIVMPNHFHCIVENTGGNVGADLRVCPDDNAISSVNDGLSLDDGLSDDGLLSDDGSSDDGMGRHIGLPLRVCPDNDALPLVDASPNDIGNGGGIDPPRPDDPIFGEHLGSPLGSVIQWFKTMSTNEYIRNVKSNNWPRFDGKLWQRNYWEHIIRDEKSYHRIAEYIINNPKNWDDDSIHPKKNNG